MAKSNRALDMQQDNTVIMPFLSTYLFHQMWDNFEVVEDTERQFKGIDVIVHYEKYDDNVDVKSQASAKYINSPVPTFVLECLFTNQAKKEQIGWWLDENLLTDSYLCVWVHAAKTNSRGLIDSPDDIIDIEIMLVDKLPLQEYIESKGYTHEALLNRARWMRKIGIHAQASVLDEQPDDEMWLTYSPQLAEKPVNLVIKKRVLKKFATRHARVTKSGVFDIVNDVL
ncbi:MAG: hypothetical protein IJZ68_08115 [Bacteroidaceae bacterium]|nr:hypothetical protein [Bacteroidaceae bacterium]